jgi:hypothetical protein
LPGQLSEGARKGGDKLLNPAIVVVAMRVAAKDVVIVGHGLTQKPAIHEVP